jgi:hypothetical protein
MIDHMRSTQDESPVKSDGIQVSRHVTPQIIRDKVTGLMVTERSGREAPERGGANLTGPFCKNGIEGTCEGYCH